MRAQGGHLVRYVVIWKRDVHRWPRTLRFTGKHTQGQEEDQGAEQGQEGEEQQEEAEEQPQEDQALEQDSDSHKRAANTGVQSNRCIRSPKSFLRVPFRPNTFISLRIKMIIFYSDLFLQILNLFRVKGA